MQNDDFYMGIALSEARKGEGRTSPNPCVGAVIVRDDIVISKGYHKKAGTPHAEVNAIKNTTASLAGSTIYVTLEPCNHTGRTPPCTQLIVEKGITRVVIGVTDPNPLVDGSGIDFLREHGLEVVVGILRDECEEIIRPFVKRITRGIPWMIMKAGISLDGKINYARGNSGWITGKQSLAEVHRMRDRVDAILVGSGTVRVDDPSLTTRIQGKDGKDPIRVVIDTHLRLPLNSSVYHLKSEAPTWVFCSNDTSAEKIAELKELGVVVELVSPADNGLDLMQVMEALGKGGVCSVLVEGGARLHGSLLKEKLFDGACLFYAPLFAGDDGVSLIEGYSVQGRPSAPRLAGVSYKRLGDDIMVAGRFQYG